MSDQGSSNLGRRGGRRAGVDSRGQSRGGGNKPASGPGGFCVCPQCGHKEPHQAGVRCLDQNCPKCGAKMIRE